MKKQMMALILGLTGLTALADSPPAINFAVDCMIHDNQGNMLADLGTVGAGMNGQYLGDAHFTFSDMKIEANLNGPFPATPEVATPHIELTVTNFSGDVLASLVTTANPDINVAMLVPSENVYLHCDRMQMGMK